MVRKTELCNAKTFLQDDLRRTESSVGYLGEKGKKRHTDLLGWKVDL